MRLLPPTVSTANSARKTAQTPLAIQAPVPVMPVKPSNAARKAMIKNAKDQPNISVECLDRISGCRHSLIDLRFKRSSIRPAHYRNGRRIAETLLPQLHCCVFHFALVRLSCCAPRREVRAECPRLSALPLPPPLGVLVFDVLNSLRKPYVGDESLKWASQRYELRISKYKREIAKIELALGS